MLAHDRQAPYPKTAYKDEPGAECQGLDDIAGADFVDSNRGGPDRRVDSVAEDTRGVVAGVGVHEHACDDAVAVEGSTVGEVGGRHTGVGGGVAPAAFGKSAVWRVFRGCRGVSGVLLMV